MGAPEAIEDEKLSPNRGLPSHSCTTPRGINPISRRASPRQTPAASGVWVERRYWCMVGTRAHAWCASCVARSSQRICAGGRCGMGCVNSRCFGEKDSIHLDSQEVPPCGHKNPGIHCPPQTNGLTQVGWGSNDLPRKVCGSSWIHCQCKVMKIQYVQTRLT